MSVDPTQFNRILQEWSTSNIRDNNQDLIETIRRIFTDCYQSGDSVPEMITPVSNRNYHITTQTLPKELFCYPPFNRYSVINLSDWGIQEVPETISLNSELECLNLSNNPITTLCKDIGNLKHLKTLILCNTNLSSLPEEIGELHSLECLLLSGNQLDEVPLSLGKLKNLTVLDLSMNRREISHDNDLPKGLMACLGKLENLEELAIANNRLEELPRELIETFPGMKQLTQLDLSSNNLRRFPENIGESFKSMEKLTALLLSDNSLSELPPQFFTSLKDLKNLLHIDLSNNRLRTLPDTFRELGPEVTLKLSRNHFSSLEVGRILQITQEPGYNGPRIELSIHDRRGRRAPQRSLQIVNELIHIAKLPQIQPFHLGDSPEPNSWLHRLEDSLALNSWLNRLSEIPEFTSATNKQLVARKILAILEQASLNPSFKKIFDQVIQEASATCGDRVALSLLKLDVLQKLESTELTDIKGLSHVLKNGVWTLDLLEKCAREKVAKLAGGVDEIETYLAYPILLKNSLNIPIVQEGMLYFMCSRVTQEDLQEAKNIVEMHRNDEEKFLEFLGEQDKWIEALRVNYPNEMEEIETAKEVASNSENIDLVDYDAIKKEYMEKISALSKKALAEKETE